VPVREPCGTALRSVLGTPRWSPRASVSTPPRRLSSAAGEQRQAEAYESPSYPHRRRRGWF
jgi:hypothetical protein